MNTDQVIEQTVLQGRQLSKTEEACLCIMVKKDYKLIEEQQELLEKGLIFRLTREDACKLLAKYVKDGRRLEEKNHPALFEVDNAEELVRTYFRTWSLSDAAEMKLFELDPTGKLAVEYSEHSAFGEEAELKFMTLPGIVEAQRRYVARGPISAKTRNKLLESVYGEEFILQELELRRIFAATTQVKMLSVPRAHEWMKRYTNYAKLAESAQMKLFKMAKPKKMVRRYDSRQGLCEKAKELAEKNGWL